MIKNMTKWLKVMGANVIFSYGVLSIADDISTQLYNQEANTIDASQNYELTLFLCNPETCRPTRTAMLVLSRPGETYNLWTSTIRTMDGSDRWYVERNDQSEELTDLLGGRLSFNIRGNDYGALQNY